MQAKKGDHSRNMHVYTFEAKNTPNPITAQKLSQKVRGKHPVKVEAVPGATGKHTLTTTYMQFLSVWARRLSWSEVATIFHTSWEKVFHSVQWMVGLGLEHRPLTRMRSVGIDEVAWRKGHEYLTLVYQIDGHCQRLLWVGKDRTVKTLLRFFRRVREGAGGPVAFHLQRSSVNAASARITVRSVNVNCSARCATPAMESGSARSLALSSQSPDGHRSAPSSR
jgi:hypothetical protein